MSINGKLAVTVAGEIENIKFIHENDFIGKIQFELPKPLIKSFGLFDDVMCWLVENVSPITMYGHAGRKIFGEGWSLYLKLEPDFMYAHHTRILYISVPSEDIKTEIIMRFG